MVLEWTIMNGRNPEQHGSHTLRLTQIKLNFSVLPPVTAAYIFHSHRALISLNNTMAWPGIGQAVQTHWNQLPASK
jgi:hypothetical protein